MNEPTKPLTVADGDGSQLCVKNLVAFGREVDIEGRVRLTDPVKLRVIAYDLLARADWLEGKL